MFNKKNFNIENNGDCFQGWEVTYERFQSQGFWYQAINQDQIHGQGFWYEWKVSKLRWKVQCSKAPASLGGYCEALTCYRTIYANLKAQSFVLASNHWNIDECMGSCSFAKRSEEKWGEVKVKWVKLSGSELGWLEWSRLGVDGEQWVAWMSKGSRSEFKQGCNKGIASRRLDKTKW